MRVCVSACRCVAVLSVLIFILLRDLILLVFLDLRRLLKKKKKVAVF